MPKIEQKLLESDTGRDIAPFEPKPWVPGFGGHRVEDVPHYSPARGSTATLCNADNKAPRSFLAASKSARS